MSSEAFGTIFTFGPPNGPYRWNSSILDDLLLPRKHHLIWAVDGWCCLGRLQCGGKQMRIVTRKCQSRFWRKKEGKGWRSRGICLFRRRRWAAKSVSFFFTSEDWSGLLVGRGRSEVWRRGWTAFGLWMSIRWEGSDGLVERSQICSRLWKEEDESLCKRRSMRYTVQEYIRKERSTFLPFLLPLLICSMH